MSADHYAGLILITLSLLWIAAGCVRAASEAADSERPSLPTDTPIHDALWSEVFAEQLDCPEDFVERCVWATRNADRGQSS